MRKQMRKLLWLRRSLGFLLGLALVSSLVLPPRSALAAAATEPDYFAALKDAWGYSTKVGGWISKGASAWNVADKILVFVGLLDPPLTLDDIKAEIERIAQYQGSRPGSCGNRKWRILHGEQNHQSVAWLGDGRNAPWGKIPRSCESFAKTRGLWVN